MANSGEDSGAVEQTPGDREDFNVWHKGNDLVTGIIGAKTADQKVIVIINAPAVVNLPWKDDVDGILYIGWGSGATDINYDYISEPLEAITKKVEELPGTIKSSTALLDKGNNVYEE